MTGKDNLPPAMRRWLDAQQQFLDGWSELLRQSAEAMQEHAPDRPDASPRRAQPDSDSAPPNPERSDTPVGSPVALAELAIASWEAAQRAQAEWLEAANAYAQRWMQTTSTATLDAMQGAIERDAQWRRYLSELQDTRAAVPDTSRREPDQARRRRSRK